MKSVCLRRATTWPCRPGRKYDRLSNYEIAALLISTHKSKYQIAAFSDRFDNIPFDNIL
jgi:hypothetical protein